MGFDEAALPKQYRSIEERWEWTVSYMILEDRFVHEILMLMEKRSTTSLPTMGVTIKDGKIILYYNPDFINALSDPELRFVATHEVFHLILHHCTLRMPEREEDASLYNKAADLAINCLISQTHSRKMPGGKYKGLMPADFKFEDKLSMEQYVMLLEEDEKKNGNGKGKGQGFDDHSGWSDKEGAELIKQAIRNKVEELSHRENVWGKMPGDLKDLIIAAQRSQIKWQRYLKMHFGKLITSKFVPTFTRPNRRYGYPYCGRKRSCVDRKLVGIDTSGSIGSKDKATFLGEVNRLAEVQPVDLQLFDDGLQGVLRPFEKKHAQWEMSGGGGTSFQHIVDLADKMHYQSLIILTDGCADAPTKPKFVKDILWVIIGDGKPPVDWGTVINIHNVDSYGKKLAA